MKLLGWIHRKLRQNSSEIIKDFAAGYPSPNDEQYFLKPDYCTKPFVKTQRTKHLRRSFANLESTRAEQEDLEEDPSAAFNELFHGFLTIGTLGADPVTTDPSTPTFAISVNNITEKEAELAEREAKIIDDEMEKVLGAEGKYYGFNESSHGSTYSLSWHIMEGKDNDGNITTVCPLQGYLHGLGSAGLPETAMEKKEQRISLGELFKKTKMVDGNYGFKWDKGGKQMYKETDKSAVNLMKKMPKRRMIHASSRSSTAGSGGSTGSTSAEKKINKILHMFQKKVHPESSTAAEKTGKAQKNVMRHNINCEAGNNDGDRVPLGDYITIFPQRTLSKKRTQHLRSQSNPPLQVILGASDSSENRQQWINTDEDYLVLEF